MSCFCGGVDGGSAGCQTSLRQRQPSPRATCLWVLGLHSSLRPGFGLPRHTKTGDGRLMLAGLRGVLSSP